MCLWWWGTDSGCWQDDWCCGLDKISPVRGCCKTATLPIFIRPQSLASVCNDILMYNLQAHPKAEVAYMMEWNKWEFWQEAYGVLFYNPTACFVSFGLINSTFLCIIFFMLTLSFALRTNCICVYMFSHARVCKQPTELWSPRQMVHFTVM